MDKIKYPLLSLTVLSLLLLLPHLGLLQTNIMEARNIISAREMNANHEWIFTTLNGLPRYEKPPLPTWLTSISGAIFGFENLFYLRLPVALVTVLLVLFFYKLVLRAGLRQRHAFNASLILLTSFYIFFSGRDNQWDMYAESFMLVSIYFLARIFKEAGYRFTLFIAAIISFGASLLSKGPVALYALFLPFIISWLIIYKTGWKRNLLYTIIVLIGGIIIGISWPAWVRFHDAANVTAIASKEAGRWLSYNTRPIWYYWNFFIQSGIWTVPAVISLAYPYMKTRVKDLPAYKFTICWTLLSVILLSLIPEKKPRYLLPALIPLAWNSSFYTEYLIDEYKTIQKQFEKILAWLSFGVIGLVGISAPLLLWIFLKKGLEDDAVWWVLTAVGLLAAGIIILFNLWEKNMAVVFKTTIALLFIAVGFGLPLTTAHYFNPDYFAAKDLSAIEKKYEITTYEADLFTPEIILDYGKPIPALDSTITGKSVSKFGLLVFPENADAIKKQLSNYSLEKIAAVDLNRIAKGRKGWSNRLQKDYYLVRKN